MYRTIKIPTKLDGNDTTIISHHAILLTMPCVGGMENPECHNGQNSQNKQELLSTVKRYMCDCPTRSISELWYKTFYTNMKYIHKVQVTQFQPHHHDFKHFQVESLSVLLNS